LKKTKKKKEMKHLKKFNESVNTEYVVKSKVNLYRGENPTEFTDKYKTKEPIINL
jgi:predicted RNase H-like nuclease